MFTLPDLPYQYDALAPFVSAEIQHLHHDKHHRAYVDNLNKALEKYPELQNKTIEFLLINPQAIPVDIQTTVRNNGGGHYNHSMFWLMMAKAQKQEPTGTLLDKLQYYFGDIDTFKKQFGDGAIKIFGSGWQWLVFDLIDKTLKITSTPNQDSPISNGNKQIPLLGLDVWEHAYYLQYYNKRPDYVAAWWNIVNWDDVSKRLDIVLNATKD